MTEKDLRKIWIMLGRYYPASRRTKDEAEFRAYLRILGPYQPEDVYDACVAHIRAGERHFPDVDDITSRLPALSSPSTEKPAFYQPTRQDIVNAARELAVAIDYEIPEGLGVRETVVRVAEEARARR